MGTDWEIISKTPQLGVRPLSHFSECGEDEVTMCQKSLIVGVCDQNLYVTQGGNLS